MFSQTGRRPFQAILTGAIGVGKTTLVNRLLPLIKPKIAGFRTLPVYHDRIKIGYNLQPLAAAAICFARFNSATGRYDIDPNVFEQYGCAALKAALLSEVLILIDELGVFEQPATDFCQLVKSILDSDRDYLVVIQQRALAFWLNGITSTKFDLYEITPASREAIFNHLVEQLRAIEAPT